MSPGIVLALLVSVGIDSYDDIVTNKRAPIPGHLLASIAIMTGCSFIAEVNSTFGSVLAWTWVLAQAVSIGTKTSKGQTTTEATQKASS